MGQCAKWKWTLHIHKYEEESIWGGIVQMWGWKVRIWHKYQHNQEIHLVFETVEGISQLGGTVIISYQQNIEIKSGSEHILESIRGIFGIGQE